MTTVVHGLAARGKHTLSVAVAATAFLLPAPPAAAQLRQYSSPGQLATREIPSRDTLRQRMANAPWQAGKWRLQPRLALGNLVYTNNVFDTNDVSEQVSDLRASATAGIDAYAPIGSDMVFATFARPSYSWWRDNEEQRRLNWSYGAAVFGLFNRLSTELSVRRTETERPINNELRIPTAIRSDRIAFDARLSIRGPWQVFGSVGLNQSRYPNASALAEQAPQLDLLARDEDVLSAGVAYDLPNRVNIGIGWRSVDSQFTNDPERRSNSGQYPFLVFGIPGNKLQLEGSIGVRLLEFGAGSQLEESEQATGTLRASFDVGRRTSVSFFSGRDIVYSAVDAGGFFASQRAGAALSWGDSVRTTFFAQAGEDEFESAGEVNPGRIDDGESYGLQFRFPLRWGLVMNLRVAETSTDSNFDEFDRSRTAITSSVSLDLPDFPF